MKKKKDIPSEVPNPCRNCGEPTIRQFGYCKKCLSKLRQMEPSLIDNTTYALLMTEIYSIKNRLSALESRFVVSKELKARLGL